MLWVAASDGIQSLCCIFNYSKLFIVSKLNSALETLKIAENSKYSSKYLIQIL